MRYVYILRSNTCPWRHYVGVTLDPVRRLIAHNAGMSPHTSKYRPWSIIVAIFFEDDARDYKGHVPPWPRRAKKEISYLGLSPVPFTVTIHQWSYRDSVNHHRYRYHRQCHRRQPL